MSTDLPRTVLPIPDPQHVGVTAYDAKDPAASYPPIVPIDPPAGAPNVLIVLIDDVGFGAAVGLRRALCDAERRAPGRRRPQVQPLPHHGPLLAHPPGPHDRAQPPLRRHGGDHRDRHVGPGVQLAATQVGGPTGGDPQAQRLQHGPVRQVPRGPGVADQPDGAVRQLARRWRRLRVLLRLHRRRDEPVVPGHLRGPQPHRAAGVARRGLPLHRGHDRQGHRLGPSAEVADGGAPVLHVLRAGRHPCAAPRPRGVGREVQGTVRRRLGRPTRGDLRPAEGARRHPRGRRPH